MIKSKFADLNQISFKSLLAKPTEAACVQHRCLEDFQKYGFPYRFQCKLNPACTQKILIRYSLQTKINLKNLAPTELK